MKKRQAFTLVELLVVMTIISILVSLLLAGVYKVRLRMKEVQARSDISQLSAGISAFKVRYEVDYVPSQIVLYNNLNNYGNSQLEQDSLAFLLRLWPRIQSYPPNPGFRFSATSLFTAGSRGWFPDDPNASANSVYVLQGQQAIVFFLGGIQAADPTNKLPACHGFGTDRNNPTNISVTEAPMFDFPTARLTTGVGYTFLDSWGSQPYAYFSSYSNGYSPYGGSDCAALGVSPYFQTAPATSPRVYLNANGFQIISAGRDKLFGTGGYWNPMIGYGPNTSGSDDVGNFSMRLLAESTQ